MGATEIHPMREYAVRVEMFEQRQRVESNTGKSHVGLRTYVLRELHTSRALSNDLRELTTSGAFVRRTRCEVGRIWPMEVCGRQTVSAIECAYCKETTTSVPPPLRNYSKLDCVDPIRRL